MAVISQAKLPSDEHHWTLVMIKSPLVKVTAWCRQATSQYLNQYWHRSLPPYDVTGPQWVKRWRHCNAVATLDLVWQRHIVDFLWDLLVSCEIWQRVFYQSIYFLITSIFDIRLDVAQARNILRSRYSVIITRYSTSMGLCRVSNTVYWTWYVHVGL